MLARVVIVRLTRPSTEAVTPNRAWRATCDGAVLESPLGMTNVTFQVLSRPRDVLLRRRHDASLAFYGQIMAMNLSRCLSRRPHGKARAEREGGLPRCYQARMKVL